MEKPELPDRFKNGNVTIEITPLMFEAAKTMKKYNTYKGWLHNMAENPSTAGTFHLEFTDECRYVELTPEELFALVKHGKLDDGVGFGGIDEEKMVKIIGWSLATAAVIIIAITITCSC